MRRGQINKETPSSKVDKDKPQKIRNELKKENYKNILI